jgi:hypothetical protein
MSSPLVARVGGWCDPAVAPVPRALLVAGDTARTGGAASLPWGARGPGLLIIDADHLAGDRAALTAEEVGDDLGGPPGGARRVDVQ